MSLTSLATRRPVSTVSAVLALVLLGAVSLSRLPVSLLPDVTLPVLTIRTLYEGAAATEVSRFIAEPVEEAIAATPGLVELRSVSRNGEATTTARFAWGTDMATTVLAVRERLDNARSRLPERAERPTLLTSDPGERPIAVLGLTGPGDLMGLAETAEEVHARRLEQLPGVASVAVVGAPEREIRVEVEPERMRALGLSPRDVARALAAANASAPGGTIRRGQFRFSVRALTEFRDVGEIAQTPVGPAAAGIRLGDIARITLTTADPRTVTRLDGGDAVGMVVYKDAGANTVAVTRDIERALGTLAADFPDIKLWIVAAQAEFVTDALANLGQEIILGGILSLLVILVFLRDWRGSLAIGLIVPLSVMVALTLLQLLDVTINILSLGGLALGVGLLVDNAIVVAEAAGRHGEQGMSRLDSARAAAEEVAGPLVAGTLTTLLVFGPIVFVRGLAAALFRDLSLSVVLSLGASLVLALTLLPVMLARGRGRDGATARRHDGTTAGRQAANSEQRTANGEPFPGYDRLLSLYDRGMSWSLANPGKVIAAGIAGTGLMVLLLLGLPKEILPQVDEGVAVADLRLLEGTAIEETVRQAGRVEAAARELGSAGVYARVGVATDEEVLAGADPGSAATAQLIIPVPQGRGARQFAADLRAALPDLAAGSLTIDLAGQSEFGSLIGREGRVVRVEVAAPRLEAAEAWADSARGRLAALPTLADVRGAFSGTQPMVELALVRDRIARQGLAVETVADALSGGIGGLEATDFRETDRRTPVTVRLAGTAHENLEAALATPVGGIPVGQLVEVKETRAPIEVVRVDQRPVSIVEATVERGGTARAERDVGRALAGLEAPAGLTWRISGADAERRRTSSELGLVALLSVALVFLVLAGEFASFTTPLVVMLTVPLAGTGSLLALWLTGQSLNAVALIGMVVMIGIADNDAVVKLDAIRRYRDAGHPLHEAIHLGGRQRFRPIAMTSLTTITGVLPLVFGLGSGGQLYQPLAAAVIGGSVTATLVTFFLMPVVYALVEGGKKREGAGSSGMEREGATA